MSNIFIVDYLGIHCGMHYYLEAFKKVLCNLPGVEIGILSNYSDSNENPFFRNQYKGIILNKGLSLIYNLIKLKSFIKKNQEAYFIYLTYGNPIDVPFLKVVTSARHHIVDIHEAIAQNHDKNEKLKAKFKRLYSLSIKGVISHSSRTDDFLKQYGYKGTKLFVPHFRYIFPKSFDSRNIASEVKNAIDSTKINLLFFGNLNESKGIDILMEAINLLDKRTSAKLNVVIAGKDFDGSIDRVVLLPDRKAHIIRRHITDDELRFLYQSVDYISLPYRKTSQSGILEMAFYFRKPIIASDVPYFRKTLVEFPSFGVLAGNSPQSYADTLSKVIESHKESKFYSDMDYNHYENRKETKLFLNNFRELICNSKK